MEVLKEKVQFQKYPVYKDSGVEWLHEIPEHWKIVRMKYLFNDYSEKNRKDSELLSVTQDKGVVPRSWVVNRMVMPSGNLESFKFIEKGDFAISLRSFEGGLEYCHHDGIISPAYTVLKQRRNDLRSAYYKYLFKSHSFISELQTSVVGIREGKNISFNELSYSLMPIPVPNEQTAIASFLDEKCGKIDAAIEQKQKLIELLKERKQIIIQNAVTNGLDSDVKMKDSGVEWIGEIPAHWEVKKLKYFVDIQGGFAFDSSDFREEGIQIIKIANTYQNQLSLERQPTFVDPSYLISHKDWVVSQGDILMSLTGTLGKKDYGFAIIIENEEKYLLNQRVAKLSIKKNSIEPAYLLAILHSDSYLNQLYSLPAGTKQANLSNDNVTNIKMPIPPKPERDSILDLIRNAKSKLDTAIVFQQQQIEKLKEYKSSLIDAAVTGKIKVGK